MAATESVDLWRASLLAGDRGLIVAAGLPKALGFDKKKEKASAANPAGAGHGLLSLVQPSNIARLRSLKLVLALLGGDELRRSVIEDEWGLLLREKQVVGLLTEQRTDPTTGESLEIWVMGCAACHVGRANGQNYLGLGNKTVDVWRMADDATAAIPILQRVRRRPMLATSLEMSTSPLAHRFDQVALEFAKRLAQEPWMNQAQGLVPTSLVFWWFHATNNEPFPARPPRGEVKVPAWWGYANRRGTDPNAPGLFCDGFGTGPGWPGGAELGGGPSWSDIGTDEFKRRVQAIEASLATLDAPRWPADVKPPEGDVDRGKALFHGDKFRCSGCHGDEGKGFGDRGRKSIPIDRIGTDPERLRMTTTGPFAAQYREMVQRVGEKPGLQGWFSFAAPQGYVAPRLDGIWARFPYLHNGSVPTLRALLSPPETRPVAFDLTDAGETWRFDPEDVGLDVRCFNRNPPKPFTCRSPAELQEASGNPRAFPRERRAIYDTRRLGLGNGGHYFDSWPRPIRCRDQDELIAYLATL